MSSRWLRMSAWLGIVFGIFLVFAETRRNWGDWGHWASYTFDYLFAVLLVLFGALVLQGYRAARLLLGVTWALVIWLFTWSFLGHVQNIDGPTNGPIPNRELTIWIGALDVIAMFGLFWLIVGAIAGSRSDHRDPEVAPTQE
jgi:hypothetical protein